MDLLADRFDRTSVSVVGEDDGITEIGHFVSSFGVDPDEIQLLPYFLKHAIEIEFHVAADDDGVGLQGDHVDLLHGDGIDFVVAEEALDVFAVAWVGGWVP